MQAPNAEAVVFDISEYFPLNQGNSWTYAETGTEFDGTPINFIRTELMNGVENVDYNGTIHSGVKIFPDSTIGEFEVTRITAQGLELIKFSDVTEFTLFGSPASTNPTQPLRVLPRTFAEGDSYVVDYKEYTYNLAGGLLGTSISNESFTFSSIANITVPAGTFSNILKIHNIANFGNGESQVNETYLAKNIGIVKETSVGTFNSQTSTGNTELISYSVSVAQSVVPEPATVLLFGSGMIGAFIRKKFKENRRRSSR